MSIVYGSVCSGIEAASVAWEPLGWSAAWFAEIEPFPSAVLDYHWHHVPNLGDMTKLGEHDHYTNTAIDLLVGGTPCQSFSQAGKRLGLDDPRGNLALHFLRIAREKRPRWIVWENVPGVLTSDKGNDFAEIIQTMVDSGYGVSWRKLDSRFFGVPQNRHRVFVVGHLGDWRPAAAVLFERPSPSDDAPRDGDAQGRIPVCTVRNAGNANARGVVVAEDLGGAGNSELRGPQLGKGQDDLQLRRLTPEEEERRMGFSGTHTAIPDAPDAKRYKAIGNSMAVPVMRWIGEGIEMVEQVMQGADFVKVDQVTQTVEPTVESQAIEVVLAKKSRTKRTAKVAALEIANPVSEGDALRNLAAAKLDLEAKKQQAQEVNSSLAASAAAYAKAWDEVRREYGPPIALAASNS